MPGVSRQSSTTALSAPDPRCNRHIRETAQIASLSAVGSLPFPRHSFIDTRGKWKEHTVTINTTGSNHRFMSVLAFIVLVQVGGVILYIMDYPWGMIVTVTCIALIQGLTLVLLWYAFKMILLISMNGGASSQETKKDT